MSDEIKRWPEVPWLVAQQMAEDHREARIRLHMERLAASGWVNEEQAP